MQPNPECIMLPIEVVFYVYTRLCLESTTKLGNKSFGWIYTPGLDADADSVYLFIYIFYFFFTTAYLHLLLNATHKYLISAFTPASTSLTVKTAMRV